MEGVATASYWTTGCTCASVGGVGGEEGTGEFGAVGTSGAFTVGVFGVMASAALAVLEATIAWPVIAAARFPTAASTDAMIAAAPSITSVANA